MRTVQRRESQRLLLLCCPIVHSLHPLSASDRRFTPVTRQLSAVPKLLPPPESTAAYRIIAAHEVQGRLPPGLGQRDGRILVFSRLGRTTQQRMPSRGRAAASCVDTSPALPDETVRMAIVVTQSLANRDNDDANDKLTKINEPSAFLSFSQSQISVFYSHYSHHSHITLSHSLT